MRKMIVAVCVFLVVLLLPIGLVFAAGGSEKTSYPEGPIEVVIPWGAGGVTDTVARNFLPICEEIIGTTLVITNKPGASGAVGTQYALSKEADGYTVLLSAETPGTMKVLGTADIDFHDFEPIMLLAGFIPTVTVSANASWKTVQELIDAAKASPGKIIAGFAGPGSTGHVSSLLFSEQAEAKFNIVPFGSGAEVVAALLGGHVDVVFNPLGDMIENFKAGKVRILATFTNDQVEQVPSVPPLGKAVSAFRDVLPWGPMISLLVKKGTPPEVIAFWKKVVAQAVKDERWKTFTHDYCCNRLELQGDEFWKYVDSWVSTTTWLLFDSGTAKKSPADFGIPRP